MCLTEFDEKKYEDVLREEGREEGQMCIRDSTVTLDGTTVNFVATDNKVASISIDKATIPVKTATEIKPVSYTHLDVYKRQDYGRYF